MFAMQYHVPTGFPAVDARFNQAAAAMGPQLRGFDSKGAFVPNSALWIRMRQQKEGACLEFKKRDKLVYINWFCVDAEYQPFIMRIIQELYDKYDFGMAPEPTLGNFIHSVPVGYPSLRENEIKLCEQLTVAIYYAVFGKEIQRIGRAN